MDGCALHDWGVRYVVLEDRYVVRTGLRQKPRRQALIFLHSYPPSAKHWLLLLSLFRPLQNSTDAPYNIAMLPHAPSIIVLHEPSSYFLTSDSQSQPVQAELTQYLQLVTAALSLSSFLSVSGEAIPVVLFDSRLQELWMPIIRPASPTRRITSEEDTHPARKEHVERFVEKYFEWVGNVSNSKDELCEFYIVNKNHWGKGHLSKVTSWMYISHQMPDLLEAPSAPPFHGSFDALRTRSGLYQLKLYNRIAEDTRPIIWEWTESRKARRSNTGQMETHFVFHTIGS